LILIVDFGRRRRERQEWRRRRRKPEILSH